MIDSNERLVVMAENQASPQLPWYHLAYAHALQETPYSFRRGDVFGVVDTLNGLSR